MTTVRPRSSKFFGCHLTFFEVATNSNGLVLSATQCIWYNLLDMSNPNSKPNGSFLGKGDLKFNQAGNNAPLPGEKNAETPPPPLFGGPRIWVGIIVLIIAMSILFAVYSEHENSVGTVGAHQPHTINPDAPSDNPDTH